MVTVSLEGHTADDETWRDPASTLANHETALGVRPRRRLESHAE